MNERLKIVGNPKPNPSGNAKVNNAGADTSRYLPPKEPHRYVALLLAALMHVILFLFLWVGIRWQNKEVVGVDAEIWDVTTREAAPKVLSDVAEPIPEAISAPVPTPEPVPEPAPAPKINEPTPQQVREKLIEQQQAEDAEIAIVRARKQKMLDQQRQLALQEEQKEEQKKQQKDDALKLAKLKKEELHKEELHKEELRKEELRKEDEQRKADELQRQEKQDKEKKEKADAQQKIEQQKTDQKKLDAQKLKASKAQEVKDQQRQQQQDDKLRAATLLRMTGQSGGERSSKIAGSGGNGDAVKSTGNNRGDPGYSGKLGIRIKSNSNYAVPANQPGNPRVEFLIQLFPDGSLRGIPKMTKSSGVPEFDDAIARAIVKAAPYPFDSTGKVPTSISLGFDMKEK